MTTRARAALKQFEELTEKGKFRSFSIYIEDKGILIKPQGSEAAQEVPLVQEVMASLRAFFYEVDCIEYGSFDYTTLISFLNAS